LLDCPSSDQKQAVADSWGKWISGLRPWEWFATLTFRPPPEDFYDRRGISFVKREVQEFQAQALVGCRPRLELGEMRGVDGVWAIERHVNGSPHVHGLLAAWSRGMNEDGGACDKGRLGRRLDMVDWSWERSGMARVEAVRDLGAAFYVTKYIMKGGPECLILNLGR